jgi:aminobenzoyl-glutamate utilization protein B
MDTTRFIEEHSDLLIGLSDDLWNHPETALNEHRSSKLLAGVLKDKGFEIKTGLGGLDTAFSASWGSGRPVIGILGEYDALPGLSQKTVSRKEAEEEGAPGHGCGHNLLGSASLGAALAVKAAMEEHKDKGTVVFFGCPAEEIMTGKIRMAVAGCFDNLDAAISWHPWQYNTVLNMDMLAMNTARFTFYGKASHASSSPELGRSALDAVELMNVGVNYLREHIPSDVRIHYSVTDGGGEPNVVPSRAQSWYFIRAPKRENVDDTFNRICDIARGAALMTGTKAEISLETGCWNLLHNRPMMELFYSCMTSIKAPEWTPEEKKFAEELTGKKNMLPHGVLPMNEVAQQTFSSTDVADVSYIVPTEQIVTCTAPEGINAHTWQFTSCTGMSIGHKGMLYAASVLAMAGIKLIEDEKLRNDAKAAFTQAKGTTEYKSVIPKIFS